MPLGCSSNSSWLTSLHSTIPERWGDHLYQARARTQEASAQIRKQAAGGDSGLRRKNKMPYFLATLEQLVGLRPAPGASLPRAEHTG